MTNYQKLYHSDQQSFIAYHKITAKQNNKQGLIFLSGFKSDMHGTKAKAIAAYAEQNDYDLIRFDYSGHGNSSGHFHDGSIDSWLKDTIYVIDQLTQKPQILIGSSMGGWLMLLAALARPKRISYLIGLAAAPDFTQELIWDCLSPQEKEQLINDKQISFSNEFCQDAYPISYELITKSQPHLLLNKEIPIHVPIHLIHGMEDKDVPFSSAIRIAEKVTGKEVKISLLKNAGHGLSQPEELELIYQAITAATYKDI